MVTLKFLENQRIETRRQIALVQKEASDIMTSGESQEVVKQRLQKLYGDTRDRFKEEDAERKFRADLGRKVSEQNKLILDLKEELHIARTELGSLRELNISLNDEIELMKRSDIKVKLEIENIRELLSTAEAKARTLELENANLVGRIVEEKNKVANELNKMNREAESIKASSLFSTFFGALAPAAPERSDNSQKTGERPRTGSMIPQDYVSVDEDFSGKTGKLEVHFGIPSVAWKSISVEPDSSQGIPFVEVNDCDVGGNDQYLIVAGSDSIISVYDANNITGRGTAVRRFSAYSGPIFSLSCKGGENVVAGYADKQCRIWSLRQGRCISQLTGHNAKITSVQWVGSGSMGAGSRDEKKLAGIFDRVVSASADRSIKLWDVESSRALTTIQSSSTINSVDVTSDGHTCVTGHVDGQVRFWDMKSGKLAGCLRESRPAPIVHVTFGSRGDFRSCAALSKENSILMIDSYSFNVHQTLKSNGFRVSCDWAKASMALDSSDHIACGSSDGSVYIWNSKTGQQVTNLLNTDDSGAAIATHWTRVGLFSSYKKGKVILWR